MQFVYQLKILTGDGMNVRFNHNYTLIDGLDFNIHHEY